MDELLFNTDLVLASDPNLTDSEIAALVLSMFARHHCEGCDAAEFDEDAAPEHATLIEFVREVRQLHQFA